MSKIFRKTRQLLLSTRNTRAYLKYAIGEIALVVIGILIAVGINNYNQNRKSNKVRQDYYKQILVDLNIDKKDAENAIEKIDASLTTYNNYIETFKKPNLPVNEIVQNLSTLDMNTVVLEFQTATIKSLITNGEIKLLDPETANHLSSYNASKEVLLTTFKTFQDSYFDIFKEVLMGGLALSYRLPNQPELSKAIEDNKRTLEMYIKLDAYYHYKFIIEKEVITTLHKLANDIDSTIIIIQNNIEN